MTHPARVVVPFLFLFAACAPFQQPTESPQNPGNASSANNASQGSNSSGSARTNNASSGGSAKRQPVPAAYAADVQRSEIVGRKIFQHDVWASAATDIALDKGMLKQGKVNGWVVEEVGDGAVVHFYTPEESPSSLIRVTFPGKNAKGGTAEESAKPLSADMLSAVKARRAGADAPFPVMTNHYNTVVLPASLMGKEGWLVYMLAASTKSNEIILGGHSRILVSREGKVLDVFPLSKSIMVMRRGEGLPPGAKEAGITTTHLVTPYPVEIHVFTSMTYGLDLFVAAGNAMWIAHTDGQIEYSGAL